jgi:ABC-2 type transport system permease protein
VRREIWEHRSIYIAPLVAAGLVLFGFLIRILHLSQTMKMINMLKPEDQHMAVAIPFGVAALAICVTGTIVSFFYCLGALYNERRDRSILFWKSLPVSNTTVVLSKAAIPFVVLPAVLFGTIIATHLIMLAVGSAALAATGQNAALLWESWPLVNMSAALLYGLVAATLWYAPIWGWVLFVSSWARSMAILWAVLPPLGLCLAERIALDTRYLSALLDYRLNGYLHEAFHIDPRTKHITDPLTIITPAHYLATPGLWAGLVVGAGFIAAAVWLRRSREAI